MPAADTCGYSSPGSSPAGTRPMITPPGGRCFLTGYLYLSGAERSVDPCTTCTCNNGYITCERRTCPVLNCSQEFQVMHENECCPSCSAAAQLESVCHKFGTIYKDGDTWQLDKCTSCSCDNGKVTCHVLPCDFYMKPCPPGYRVSLAADLLAAQESGSFRYPFSDIANLCYV